MHGLNCLEAMIPFVNSIQRKNELFESRMRRCRAGLRHLMSSLFTKAGETFNRTVVRSQPQNQRKRYSIFVGAISS